MRHNIAALFSQSFLTDLIIPLTYLTMAPEKRKNKLVNSAVGGIVAPVVETLDVSGIAPRVDVEDISQPLDFGDISRRVDLDHIINAINWDYLFTEKIDPMK